MILLKTDKVEGVSGMCYNIFFVLGCCCKLGIHNAGVGQVAQVYRRQQCVVYLVVCMHVSTIDRRYDK